MEAHPGEREARALAETKKRDTHLMKLQGVIDVLQNQQDQYQKENDILQGQIDILKEEELINVHVEAERERERIRVERLERERDRLFAKAKDYKVKKSSLEQEVRRLRQADEEITVLQSQKGRLKTAGN